MLRMFYNGRPTSITDRLQSLGGTYPQQAGTCPSQVSSDRHARMHKEDKYKCKHRNEYKLMYMYMQIYTHIIWDFYMVRTALEPLELWHRYYICSIGLA